MALALGHPVGQSTGGADLGGPLCTRKGHNVHWYNHEHCHSAIKFVTPAKRHAGLDATVTVKPVPPKSVLHQHKALLEDHFNDHPPATVAQAQADIERLTGIRRGPTQVRAFLKKGSIFVGARRDPCRPRPIPMFKIGF